MPANISDVSKLANLKSAIASFTIVAVSFCGVLIALIAQKDSFTPIEFYLYFVSFSVGAFFFVAQSSLMVAIN